MTKLAMNEDGVIEVAGGFPEPSPAERAERRRVSARCGHVKRRLVQNETLRGNLLEFALSVVGENSEIGEKLRAGRPLTHYERHLMIDVYLLHERLGSRPQRSADPTK